VSFRLYAILNNRARKGTQHENMVRKAGVEPKFSVSLVFAKSTSQPHTYHNRMLIGDSSHLSFFMKRGLAKTSEEFLSPTVPKEAMVLLARRCASEDLMRMKTETRSAYRANSSKPLAVAIPTMFNLHSAVERVHSGERRGQVVAVKSWA
jgi:hypothetical protein